MSPSVGRSPRRPVRRSSGVLQILKHCRGPAQRYRGGPRFDSADGSDCRCVGVTECGTSDCAKFSPGIRVLALETPSYVSTEERIWPGVLLHAEVYAFSCLLLVRSVLSREGGERKGSRNARSGYRSRQTPDMCQQWIFTLPLQTETRVNRERTGGTHDSNLCVLKKQESLGWCAHDAGQPINSF